MDSTKGFKSNQLVATLRERIVSGEYPLGSRLPTCKELAEQHQVSYMTAYKALAQLEREGYITLKKHVGSTVSYIQDAPLPRCKSLNLVTSNAYGLRLTQDFLEEHQRLFAAAGWQVATYRIPYGTTLPDDVLLAVNSPDAFSLFFDLHTAFQNTEASQEHFYERVIYLGEYFPDVRMTTITCDEPATVRTVLEYFRAQGRTRTAIFQYHLDNVTEMQRITAQIKRLFETGNSGAAFLGEDRSELNLTVRDNKDAVLKVVEKLGYDLSAEDAEKVYETFLRLAEKNEVIEPKELDAIVASVAFQVPPTYHLESFVINSGNTISATCHLRLTRDGALLESVCVGDGPVDAAFQAIDKVVGQHYELDDFQIRSVTEGREAMGEAVVRLRHDGRLYSGRGISTDIVGSSVRAYLSAVNKIAYEEAEA